MAYSLNRAQVIGNLTRDPELRQTPTGTSVCGFSVATNSRWKDSNGEWQDRPEFHNIVCWSKLGEIAAQYLKKGSKVYIDGRMQTRDWTGDDGVKRYRTEIIAENLIILDSKSGGAPAMEREHSGVSETAKVAQEEEITVDDLPF